jgi:hypothetical protein
MRRRALLTSIASSSLFTGCLASAPQSSATTPTPPVTAEDGLQRLVTLDSVDDVDDTHDVNIDVGLVTGRITTDQPARLRITTTNLGERRLLSVSEERCGLFGRSRGKSRPQGLWLYRPEEAESLEREGTRWRRVTDDETGDCSHGSANFACSPRPYDSGKSVTTEYVVWSDYCVDEYMTPGTYRWEVPVAIYDAETTGADEPTAEFDWGLSLRVQRP